MPGLKEILQKLRREGLTGLMARLRFRRAAHLAAGGAPPLRLPLQICGGFPDLDAVLREAPLADCSGPEGSPLLVDPEARALSGAAALLFTTAERFAHFLSGQSKPQAGVMLLLPDAPSLRLAQDFGYPPFQMMLLPPDAGPEALRAGLLRWLVAARALAPAVLTPSLFPALAGLQPGRGMEQGLCLSLPEALERRAGFEALNLQGFTFFPGLRLDPGWQGAAQSYALMARGALAAGAVPLMVCEDDMQPGPGFAERLAEIRAALSSHPDWDVFAGLISDLAPEARVTEVISLPGQKLVFLNVTTGMVFNIYGPRALQRLACWSAQRGGIRENTIDAWLGQMPGLRVATTLPFLAGHNPRQRSTIFGFSNRRYDELIRRSEIRLARLVAEFEARRGGQG